MLVAHHANVNVCVTSKTVKKESDANGRFAHEIRRPLLIAAERGDLGTIRLLVDNAAHLVFKDEDGETVVHSAVRSGKKDVVDFFLSSKCAIDAKRKEGWTPLRIAVDRADVEMVKLLVANHADVEVADAAGVTPLAAAETAGNAELVNVLRAAQQAQAIEAQQRLESQWQEAKAANSIQAMEGFIKEHPTSAHLDEAHAKLASLKAEQERPLAERLEKALTAKPLSTIRVTSGDNVRKMQSRFNDPSEWRKLGIVRLSAWAPERKKWVPLDNRLFAIVRMEDMPRSPDNVIAHGSHGEEVEVGYVYHSYQGAMTLVIPYSITPCELEFRGLLNYGRVHFSGKNRRTRQ